LRPAARAAANFATLNTVITGLGHRQGRAKKPGKKTPARKSLLDAVRLDIQNIYPHRQRHCAGSTRLLPTPSGRPPMANEGVLLTTADKIPATIRRANPRSCRNFVAHENGRELCDHPANRPRRDHRRASQPGKTVPRRRRGAITAIPRRRRREESLTKNLKPGI
jgi:hypothetical protein